MTVPLDRDTGPRRPSLSEPASDAGQGAAALLARAMCAGLVSALGVWVVAAAAVAAGEPTDFGADQSWFLTVALVAAAFGGRVVASSDFDVAGVAGSLTAEAATAPSALTLVGVYLLWLTTRRLLRRADLDLRGLVTGGVVSAGVFTATVSVPALFVSSDNTNLGSTYLADYASGELGAFVQFSISPSLLLPLLISLGASALVWPSLFRSSTQRQGLLRQSWCWVAVGSGISAGVRRALILLPVVGAAAYGLLLFGDTQGGGLEPDAARAALVAAALYAPTAALAFTASILGVDLVSEGALRWSMTGRAAFSRGTDYTRLLEDEPGLYLFPVVVALWAALSWRAAIRAARVSTQAPQLGRFAAAATGVVTGLAAMALWRLSTPSAQLTGRADRADTAYVVNGSAAGSAQDLLGLALIAAAYIFGCAYVLFRIARAHHAQARPCAEAHSMADETP